MCCLFNQILNESIVKMSNSIFSSDQLDASEKRTRCSERYYYERYYYERYYCRFSDAVKDGLVSK